MKKAKLWEKEKQLCITITQELIDRPITLAFVDPIKCKFPVSMNKDKYPQQTLNFEIIKNRCISDVYKSKKDWMRDMRLFLYCISSRAEDEIEELVVGEITSLYEYALRRFDYLTLNGWHKKVDELKQKLDNLIINFSPPAVKLYIPICKLSDEDIKFGQPEYNFILKCSQYPQTPTDVLKISEILKTEENRNIVSDHPEVRIDVRLLKLKTLFLLYQYFRRRYPNEPIAP